MTLSGILDGDLLTWGIIRLALSGFASIHFRTCSSLTDIMKNFIYREFDISFTVFFSYLPTYLQMHRYFWI
jgi:hypothetical protein